jgi:hypothetical protein
MEERLNLGSDVTDLSAMRGRQRRPGTRTGLTVEFENEGGFGPRQPAGGAEGRSSRMSGFGERLSKKLGFSSADEADKIRESAQAAAAQREHMLQALPRLGQQPQSIDDFQTLVRMQRFGSIKEKGVTGVVDLDTGKFYFHYSI